MPNMNHAGVYSTVRAYLNAVVARNSDNGQEAVDEMKHMDIKDPLFANVKIRPDGRVIHDMYLARVKGAKQSTKPWDYYEILATTSGEEAFKPLKDGNCGFVAK